MNALSRRERQKQELRERILAAARDLLVAEGLEGFTMRKLAAKIDYTATAIYFHFPDKETLLLELLAGDFLAFRAALGAMPPELPPLLRLRLMGRGYINFALQHPQHYRLLFMTPDLPLLKDQLDQNLAESQNATSGLIQHDPAHPLAHVRLASGAEINRGNPAQDAYAFLVQIVGQGLESGLFRPEFTDADLLAQTIWASAHGLAALRIAKGSDPWIDWRSIDHATEVLVDGILRGLVKDPAAVDAPLPILPIQNLE